MNLYDFDKTIYREDCAYEFLGYSLRHHPYLIVTFLPRLIARIIRYGFTSKSCAFGYTIIAHLRNPSKDIKKYWDKNMHKIMPWYLKQKRDDDVVISASPTYLIKEVCERLGVKYFATDVDMKTGKLLTEVPRSIKKVNILINKLNFPKIDNFYSDSYSDTPLAYLAERSYLVNNKENKIIPWPHSRDIIKKEIKNQRLKKY